jgi:phosphopantetheine--protein transferase-like protein
MIAGVGVDILSVERLRHTTDSRDPFIRKTFTKGEIAEAEASGDTLLAYSKKFAGKEAVIKCLRTDTNSLRLDQIEILHGGAGQPVVILHKAVKALSEGQGISRVELSLSADCGYEADFAAAVTE